MGSLEKIAFYLGYINSIEKVAIPMPKAPSVRSAVNKDSNLGGETSRIKPAKVKTPTQTVAVSKGVSKVPKPSIGGAPISNPKMGKEFRTKRPPKVKVTV